MPTISRNPPPANQGQANTNLATRQAASATDALRSKLRTTPTKAYILNLDTGIHKDFLFNPTELKEKYAANYVRQAAPGLSYEKLQFSGNPNATIPLTMFFDQLFFNLQRGRGVQDGTPSDVEVWRRFIMSLVYPRRATRLIQASPPQIVFSWPGMVLMRMRIIEAEFSHTHFDVGTANARVYTCQLQLEEDVPQRIYSRDVWDGYKGYGAMRPWAANDTPNGGA